MIWWFFYFMKNLEWKPFYYNGLETNIEVTKCGRIKKIPKEWYGKGSGSNMVFYGEITNEKIEISIKNYKQVFVQISGLKPKRIPIHQILASVFLGYKFQGHKMVIDHIDSNTLNNSISNLRIVSQRENCSKERVIKSGLPVGVHYRKDLKKYRAKIRINGKQLCLGLYKTIEEASNAYQEKLKQI